MYLFDTNIFLEILLEQEKAEICRLALGALDKDSIGWVSSFSIHAIEAVIGGSKKKSKKEKLAAFLFFLKEHPFLSCYATTMEEEWEACRCMQGTGLDFDDTLQYYVAKKKNLILVTLDRDFEKIRDLAIRSPDVLIRK